MMKIFQLKMKKEKFKSKVNLTYLNLDYIIDINPGEIIF